MGQNSVINDLAEKVSLLERSVGELSFINELSQEISASHDSIVIMDSILRRSLKALKAQSGYITIFEDEQVELQNSARTSFDVDNKISNEITDALLVWMKSNRSVMSLNYPKSHEMFENIEWPEHINAILSVPMMVQSNFIGIIAVYKIDNGEGFNKDDIRLLSIVGSLSAQIIEHARLYQAEIAHEKMKEELKLAAIIQKELQPTRSPVIKGYDIAGKSKSAEEVGGDYFDFIEIGLNKIVVGVGDISGKGVPASLLMANLQATFRTLAFENHDCSGIMRRANRLLYKSTASEKYATFFISIIDFLDNSLCYSCAGHNPALFFPADLDNPILLNQGGVPLGLYEKSDYVEGRVAFSKDDLMVIYSDGVTEAMNAEDEFGLNRLIDLVIKNRGKSAKELTDTIISAIDAFIEWAPLRDDVTLVVVKKTAE